MRSLREAFILEGGSSGPSTPGMPSFSSNCLEPGSLETCISIVGAGMQLGLQGSPFAPSVPLVARVRAARKRTVLFKGQKPVCVSLHPLVSCWKKWEAKFYLRSLAPGNSEHVPLLLQIFSLGAKSAQPEPLRASMEYLDVLNPHHG